MLQLRDYFELVAVPSVASWLPARVRVAWVNAWVSFSPIYLREAETARAGISHANDAQPFDLSFSRRMRSIIGLSHAATYQLARLRFSANPTQSNTAVTDSSIGALIVAFHWGSAALALHEACARLGPTHFVSAPIEKTETLNSTPRMRYAEFAVAAGERAFGLPYIFTGGGARTQIAQALLSGHNVTVLVDVPPHQVGRVSETKVGVRNLFLPLGISELAFETKACVHYVRSCPDPDTGKFHTRWDNWGVMDTPIALLTHSGSALAQAISDEPAAWGMWAHLADFLRPRKTAADGALIAPSDASQSR